MTFGFLFIQGKALRILKVNERFSWLQENGPLRTAEKSWETLPFGLTLLGSAGMLQKLGMRGREGTRGLQKFRGQGECAGVVAGGPASARARRAGPAEAPQQREESSGPPCPGCTLPGKGNPGREESGNASPHYTHHNLPRISCPWWRLQASLYSQLPNSWWLFQKRVSKCSTNATSKRSSNPEGCPVVGDCLLALKSRFLTEGGGGIKADGPQK